MDQQPALKAAKKCFDAISDKVIIVTGASRGIGEGLARAFAYAGGRVVLVGRDEARLHRVVLEINRENPDAAQGVIADVSKTADARHVVDTCLNRWGEPHVLVSNAGISPHFGNPESLSLETWRDVIDVNLTGGFIMAQAVFPHMKHRGGHIIFTSSIHGQRPHPALAAYSASKAAIEALTKSLAQAWAEYGIRVNAVAPGYFDSPLAKGVKENDRLSHIILDHTALHRWGNIPELYPTYLYLASGLSSFVTGQVITVDGGYLLT